MIVKATSIDISIVTGTFSAIGRMYGPIIPVMKNIGRKLTITAKVAVISGGRISDTASSTMRRVAFLRSAKWREIFSTSTMGSSTKSPSDRIKAKSVTRFMVKPSIMFTARVRPKTTGTATATINASRQPRPKVSSPTTINTATARASTRSLTFSLEVRP